MVSSSQTVQRTGCSVFWNQNLGRRIQEEAGAKVEAVFGVQLSTLPLHLSHCRCDAVAMHTILVEAVSGYLIMV